MTEQYELHVQKLEIKIERILLLSYHLHMSSLTIVVRGLGVQAAVPIRFRGHLAPLQFSGATYQWEGTTNGAVLAPHKAEEKSVKGFGGKT